MKNLFKNYGVRLFCVLLCVFVGISGASMLGYAAAKNRIYAEVVTVSSARTVEIPIKIDNNSGLMGFGLVFSYDEQVLTPVSVTQGKTLLTGVLNDSIGASKSCRFQVIWSGTSNFKSDGEILILKFTVNENFKDETTINVSYSQEDTFDESYSDVKLNCENITIKPTAKKDKKAIWEKITKPFKNAWNWFKGLFTK